MLCNNDMTVVFIGFDGYADLWEDCFNLYNRFWPDRNFRTIFVNNEKEVEYRGIETLHAGADAEWSYKVLTAIKEVTTPYICLLLEDFLVGKRIDNGIVNDTVNFIKGEKIRYYKLVNMSRAVKNRDPHYKGIDYLHVIPECDEYGVSLQAAIWEVKYLKELLGTGNYNAWIFEFDRVRDASNKSNTPNSGCVFDERNILQLQHGVIQSKYLPKTIKYFKNHGIELNVQREVMKYSHYYKMRLISKVKYTLPKPLRTVVKKTLEKCGMTFVSTIRDRK